jgi:15-cis-phytoene synthase / lycopene beta-cyclase
VLQILINKPVLFAAHIRDESVPAAAGLRRRKRLGLVFLLAATVGSLLPDRQGRTGTYMKLIVLWAAPVLLFLWSISYQLLLSLPRSKTWLPIWLPTLYLWIVDTIALRRGTWSISSGTKLGIHVWPHLEIEEAVFFLVTNTLVVWGSFAFDNAVAIQDAFPSIFPEVPLLPSPIRMMKSLLVPTKNYDQARLDGLHQALTVLSKKSRSFYLASGVFSGRLRIDLILLYGFCRVADDLIDDAPNPTEAQEWIDRFAAFLDAAYAKSKSPEKVKEALKPFPPQAQSILELLPVDRLPSEPLYSLLEGFKMDSKFGAEDEAPIKTTTDLQKYASCVAATIGQLCLSLVYYHDPSHEKQTEKQIRHCIGAGTRMGRALQYINIARDVTTDANNGRCYIPQDWFESKSSQTASADETLRHREKILNMAFDIYAQDRDAIEDLPRYARDGIRVAVESYMEIGRVLQSRLKTGQSLDFAGGGKKGKASVPRSRRLLVGWKAMSGIRGSVASGNTGP